jgi:endonuclease/exonuclease/phosphatase family metal-dependent hydrolase
MKFKKYLFIPFYFLVLAFGLGTCLVAENPPIKVMSFNIRNGLAKDGDNAWPLRQDFVVETIRTFDPDLLGMQEVHKFQADYIREKMPEY